MVERMFESFARYFPMISRKTVSYRDGGYDTLIVQLDDGTAIMYDSVEHSIRGVPVDGYDMSEQECRGEFGRRLYKIMWRKGVSETELAERAGIQRTQLSKYVNGKTSPSFYIVDKIAKALGCSIDDLRYF